MLHQTKGIVLRVTKYGETSVIVLVFTEKFGIQSYLINGVRASSNKSPGTANYFQPAAILELVVYHNELKQLQRVKEFKWNYLYRNIFFDIPKNAVTLFMVELLTKCLKQPEENTDLFRFAEDSFVRLDQSDDTVTANFPLFFSLQLARFFGFNIHNGYSETNAILDLREGIFVHEQPLHPYYLEGNQSLITSKILNARQPEDLMNIKLNHEFRRELLQSYETFYALHIQEFGAMKTLPVLKEIMGH